MEEVVLLNDVAVEDESVFITYSRGRGLGLFGGIFSFIATAGAIGAYGNGQRELSATFLTLLVFLPINLVFFLVLFIRIKVIFDNNKKITKVFSLFGKPLKTKYYELNRCCEIILCKATSNSGEGGPQHWLLVLNTKIAGHLQIQLCQFRERRYDMTEVMKSIENIIEVPYRDERNVAVGSAGPQFK
jgi:hypothetical protein